MVYTYNTLNLQKLDRVTKTSTCSKWHVYFKPSSTKYQLKPSLKKSVLLGYINSVFSGGTQLKIPLRTPMTILRIERHGHVIKY